MKEVRFDHPPKLDSREERIADLHSVLNILNVLGGELSILQVHLDEKRVDEFLEISREIERLSREMCEAENLDHVWSKLRRTEDAVVPAIRSLLDSLETVSEQKEVNDSLKNVQSVFRVVDKRLDELKERSKDPDIWISIPTQEFERRFREVFYAIERNAKGRYRIFFNLARKNRGDYYIDFKVDTELNEDKLWIPLRLMDVIRDLTANARKYTAPGGKVALAVFQSADEVQVLVEDSGCGIPEDEIERVAEFGYRASNVCDRPTMGGGFGLTKAAWLVHRWGGSLSIASGLGEGTVVRLTVPNKPCGDAETAAQTFVI